MLRRQELKTCPAATLEERPHVRTAQCRTTASLSPLSRGLPALTLPRKKKSDRQGAGRAGSQAGSATHE